MTIEQEHFGHKSYPRPIEKVKMCRWARARITNGIPASVMVQMVGYENCDPSELLVSIGGMEFSVKSPDGDASSACILFRGNIEVSTAPEIFEYTAGAIRKLLGKDVAQ